jgi:hypothetical protein
VALILGVVNEVPVPNEVPPVEAAYQLNVPALAVAPNITVPASQREPGAGEVTVGVVFTSTLAIELLSVTLQFASVTIT